MGSIPLDYPVIFFCLISLDYSAELVFFPKFYWIPILLKKLIPLDYSAELDKKNDKKKTIPWNNLA